MTSARILIFPKERILHTENEAQTLSETPSTDRTARWLLEQSIQAFLETHTQSDLEEVLSEYVG